VLFLKKFYGGLKYNGIVRISLTLANVKGHTIFSEAPLGIPNAIGTIKNEDRVPTSVDIDVSRLSDTDDVVLELYEPFKAAGNITNAFVRAQSEIDLEAAKFGLFGSDTCPVCNKNYKVLTEKKCIFCRRKVGDGTTS
jgi:hypothetical protein